MTLKCRKENPKEESRGQTAFFSMLHLSTLADHFVGRLWLTSALREVPHVDRAVR